jgi:hypothetical protein
VNVIRTVETEQEELDWSRTHQCRVSAEDINLLGKFKASIDEKGIH